MDEMLAPFLSSSVPTTSRIELSLSGRNLINTDILSKSDPYCVVYTKESWQNQYYEVARTEVIKDSLNPRWVRKVELDYRFEAIQKIRFEVRDEDSQGYDYLGHFETTVGRLVSFSGRQDIGMLKGTKGQDCGEIIIVTEEVTSSKNIVEIQFRAENLKKLAWICSNDPFLVISRSNEDGSYSVVAKTDRVRSTQDPTWDPITIRIATLCNGDYERSIRIECFDYRNNGDHRLIGACHTSLNSMHSEEDSTMMLLCEDLRKEYPRHMSVGELKVVKIHISEEISFMDYIRNGTQVHFAVAIDFTASNLVAGSNHLDPNSLHYLCDNKLNSYEIALCGVGEIIQHYDSSKLFPAFGFGAKLPPRYKKVCHEFPLNGDESNPYCSDVEEILKHYWNQLNTVQLSGPTNFSPILHSMINIARKYQDGRHYFVLLIITDGIITDIQKTKRAIIEASSLPISIIIVGVGNADFKRMDKLDSDYVRLKAGGRYAERDIVQFVPLNKFLLNKGEDQYLKSQAELAREVLAEIPEQLNGYMKSRGLKPNVAMLKSSPRRN